MRTQEGRRNSLALLAPEAFSPQHREQIQEVPTASIQPNGYQVRTDFPPESLRELADSIEARGLLEPIIVRRSTARATVALTAAEGGDAYELVAGERRLRAFKLLGRMTIPVILRDIPDSDMRLLALLENLQREDLSLLEKALAIHQLKTQLGNVEAVAKALGMSRRSGFLYARIGEADPRYHAFIKKNNLDIRSTDALLSLADRLRKKGEKKSIEAFHHELVQMTYSSDAFSLLVEKYGNSPASRNGKESPKDKAPRNHDFWQTPKECGLTFRIKKGKPLSKKEQDQLVTHASRFFAAMGAKRIEIHF